MTMTTKKRRKRDEYGLRDERGEYKIEKHMVNPDSGYEVDGYFGPGNDSRGFWLYLVPGWTWSDDPGRHIIHEPSKKKAYAETAVRCDCDDCLGTLTQPTQKVV